MQHQGATNTARKLSYRVLNRRDKTNDLIVVMSKKGKRKRGCQMKTTIDSSPVVKARNKLINYQS